MKRKILSLFLAVFLIATVGMPACAATTPTASGSISGDYCVGGIITVTGQFTVPALGHSTSWSVTVTDQSGVLIATLGSGSESVGTWMTKSVSYTYALPGGPSYYIVWFHCVYASQTDTPSVQITPSPAPSYTVPTFACEYGTQLSSLTFTDTHFTWSSSTSESLPIGTLTRYAAYTKTGYCTIHNIPITITVTPYVAHFKLEVS